MCFFMPNRHQEHIGLPYMLIAGLHAPKEEVLVPLPAIGKIQILFMIAILVKLYFFKCHKITIK